MTSWLFPSGKFSLERLQQLSSLIGKEQLVIDLSCFRRKNSWFVAINKWQTVTSLEITKGENKEATCNIYVGSIVAIFLPNNQIKALLRMSHIFHLISLGYTCLAILYLGLIMNCFAVCLLLVEVMNSYEAVMWLCDIEMRAIQNYLIY